MIYSKSFLYIDFLVFFSVALRKGFDAVFCMDESYSPSKGLQVEKEDLQAKLFVFSMHFFDKCVYISPNSLVCTLYLQFDVMMIIVWERFLYRFVFNYCTSWNDSNFSIFTEYFPIM